MDSAIKKDIIEEITLPEGTRAAIMPFSEYPAEKEVIIQRNYTYQITDVSIKEYESNPGHFTWVLKLTIVPE